MSDDDDSIDPATGRTSREHLLGSLLEPKLRSKFLEARARGVSDEDLLVSMLSVTSDFAHTHFCPELRRRAPEMLAEHRNIHSVFGERLEASYGAALDLMYQIYVCAEEMGSDLQQVFEGQNDPVADALVALHARACLVILEVHALLSAGLPLGAYARARTLHENAIVAAAIGQFGRLPDHEELAARFLQHHTIDLYRDMNLEIKAGVQLDEEYVAEITVERNRLKAQYGNAYLKDYGWSSDLLGGDSYPTLAKLEAKVQSSRLDRRDYRTAGHHIHASAHSVELTVRDFRGKSVRLTGPTNLGLVEPAMTALMSILDSCWTLALYVSPRFPEPRNLLYAAAIDEFVGDALGLFVDGESEVKQRETDFLASGADADN
jgi:hypothetical protein